MHLFPLMQAMVLLTLANGTPVVLFGGEGARLTALALATNQVRQDPQDNAVAIEAWVDVAVFPPPGLAASVLGNITDGIILLDGSPITPPWPPSSATDIKWRWCRRVPSSRAVRR